MTWLLTILSLYGVILNIKKNKTIIETKMRKSAPRPTPKACAIISVVFGHRVAESTTTQNTDQTKSSLDEISFLRYRTTTREMAKSTKRITKNFIIILFIQPS